MRILLCLLLLFVLDSCSKSTLQKQALKYGGIMLEESADYMLKLTLSNSKSELSVPFILKMRVVKSLTKEENAIFTISQHFKDSKVVLVPRPTPLNEHIRLGSVGLIAFPTIDNSFATTFTEISNAIKKTIIKDDSSSIVDYLRQSKVNDIEYLKDLNKMKLINRIDDTTLLETYIDPAMLVKAYNHFKLDSKYVLSTSEYTPPISSGAPPPPPPAEQRKNGKIRFDFKDEWLKKDDSLTANLIITHNIVGNDICFSCKIGNDIDVEISYAVIWIFEYQKNKILSNTPKYATFKNRQLAFAKETMSNEKNINFCLPYKEIVDNYRAFDKNRSIIPIVGLFDSNKNLIITSSFIRNSIHLD